MSMPTQLSELKRNKKPLSIADYRSLAAMLVPAAGLPIFMVILADRSTRFEFLLHPFEYPFELILMIACGVVASAGGISDWVFHRMYVTAGPNERRAHFLALGTGGIPLFILMCLASASPNPLSFLIPVIVVALYTATLICYDEFLFHFRRCLPIETLFHRMLVFGNTIAWLAWVHWCFVRGISHG